MRMFRLLTPLGWAFAAAGGLGFRWDPFNQTQRRLQTAQAQAQVGQAEAAARRLEAEAAVQQTRRLDQFHQQQTATARTTAIAVEQARSADDAKTPLDARRAERLRGHDRELCRLAPREEALIRQAKLSGKNDSAFSAPYRREMPSWALRF